MTSFKPRPTHPYAHAPRLPDAPAIDIETLFEAPSGQSSARVYELEVGPGRGGFLIERCEARPDVYIVGLEIRLKWATIINERLKKRGFGNRAKVFAEDAREALGRLGPAGVLSAVFLHFPDPWWKKRHEKRLVMGDALLENVVRLLKEGGELFVQTDVEERALMYEDKISACAGLVAYGDREGEARMMENPYEARSPREHQAIRDGLPIYRLRYRRVGG